jgi:hypothetical protein
MNLLLRDYQRAEPDDVRTQANDAGFHSPVIFLERHVDPSDPRSALLDSLQLAVRSADRAPAEGYLYGPAALEAWAVDLRAYETYTAEEQRLLFLANWWSLMHLLDAREAAVQFLEGNADLLTGDEQAALGEALDAYRQEAQVLRDFFDAHLAFVQWYGGTQQATDWDAATRQAQSELLAHAAGLEETALAAVSRAARP